MCLAEPYLSDEDEEGLQDGVGEARADAAVVDDALDVVDEDDGARGLVRVAAHTRRRRSGSRGGGG